MSYDIDLISDARLWPYAPDWSSGFAAKRSFETDVFTTRDGTEQRRALRQVPRLSASYQTILSGDERRSAEQHLRVWQNKPVVVPDFARWTRLTAPSGSASLTVSPLPAWAVAGQAIVLCKLGVQEQALIESASGTTITLADTLANSFATDDVVRPSFFGLFDAKITSQQPNLDTSSIAVSVTSYPGSEPPVATGTAWATLGAYEVFTLEPDYSGAISLDHVWPVEQVDFTRGRTAQFRPIDWPALQSDATFNGLSTTQAGQVEQFFDRMKGRRGAFYMPTFARDFAPVAYGSSSFSVAGAGLASDSAAIDFAVVNEGVAVCLTDGTKVFRRITGITASGGNSVVTVDSSWSLSSGTVTRISRMPLARFGSDDLTMSWRTPLAASTRFSYLQVKA